MGVLCYWPPEIPVILYPICNYFLCAMRIGGWLDMEGERELE